MRYFLMAVAIGSLAVVSGPVSAEDAFRFRDVLARQGIDPVVNAPGFRTHAAAWGDLHGLPRKVRRKSLVPPRRFCEIGRRAGWGGSGGS